VFMIEDTGKRIGCLLNPESFGLRRQAGVKTMNTLGGMLTKKGVSDTPLLFTGGGQTEFTLDLLFDVNLAGSSFNSKDVRDLTRPLHELAENKSQQDNNVRPPLIRFVWGKAWNIPCVVTNVAERFEQFTSEGLPRRSWLRLRLIRVQETSQKVSDQVKLPAMKLKSGYENVSGGALNNLQIRGGSAGGGKGGVPRLDLMSQKHLGHAGAWRAIAQFNSVDNPLKITAGQNLIVPPRSLLETLS